MTVLLRQRGETENGNGLVPVNLTWNFSRTGKLMKTTRPIARREFIQTTARVVAAAAAGPALLSPLARAAEKSVPTKMIGLQAGSVSFTDEGVDQVLDLFQEQGAINTIFLTTFTYGRGLGGRQVPGQPFPDHGKRESDEKMFHGGNYATPHAQYYKNTGAASLLADEYKFGRTYSVAIHWNF